MSIDDTAELPPCGSEIAPAEQRNSALRAELNYIRPSYRSNFAGAANLACEVLAFTSIDNTAELPPAAAILPLRGSEILRFAQS